MFAAVLHQIEQKTWDNNDQYHNPNVTVIILTCTKLAQLKLEPYYSKNLNGDNKVTVVKSVRVNLNICDGQDTSSSYIRFFICDLPSLRCRHASGTLIEELAISSY